jgi:4-amino-4-deoxy-L-arabinose transferase-like glycosyltransferase
VARLGRRLGGAAVGNLSALALAVYEPDIFYVGEIDKTCLSVFLACATLALGLGCSLPARLGSGIALGLASLTRANFLVLAPFAALVFVTDSADRIGRVGRLPRSILGAALFAGGLALCLGPVAWRNHRVSGEWFLTTSQAGQNFYTGNNPTNPYGAYGALPFVRGNPHFEEADFRTAAEARVGRPLGPSEVSRFWFAEAFRHMRAHRGFAARAMVSKLALFWNDFEISDNQDQYLLERASWVLRLPLLGFGTVAPLALLGAVAGFRARREVRLLTGFVALYCASVVAFFMFSRYRIQVVPALIPLAASGAGELAARVRAADWKRSARAVALVAAAAFFSFHRIGIFSRHHELVIDMQLAHLGDIYLTAGEPEKAIAILQDAVRRCPARCRFALDELCNVYLRTGRLAEGETFFVDFIRAHPTHPDAARHLARLRDEASGRALPAAP